MHTRGLDLLGKYTFGILFVRLKATLLLLSKERSDILREWLGVSLGRRDCRVWVTGLLGTRSVSPWFSLHHNRTHCHYLYTLGMTKQSLPLMEMIVLEQVSAHGVVLKSWVDGGMIRRRSALSVSWTSGWSRRSKNLIAFAWPIAPLGGFVAFAWCFVCLFVFKWTWEAGTHLFGAWYLNHSSADHSSCS